MHSICRLTDFGRRDSRQCFHRTAPSRAWSVLLVGGHKILHRHAKVPGKGEQFVRTGQFRDRTQIIVNSLLTQTSGESDLTL